MGKRKVSGLSLSDLDVCMVEAQRDGRLKSLHERVLRRINRGNANAVEQLMREEASVVHVHFGTDAVELWPTLKRLGLPVFVTLHGYDITIHKSFWESGAAGRFQRKYPRRLLQLAQSPQVHFIAVSEAIKSRAIEFGISPNKIRVHYIGVDVAAFSSSGPPMSQRPRKILCIGRLVEKKGMAYLIEAYSRVRAQIPDAELVIVGDGPLREDLVKLADRLRAPITFAGSLDRVAIKRHLDESRLFCLASVRAESGDAEGFPIVLLEAQAAGVPVVTSAHGGAKEGVIEGVTGLTFPERDVDRLAASLAALLVDEERLERMSKAAHEMVATRFSIGACTLGLEHSYHEVLSDAKKGFRERSSAS
ncbi:MAG: glycosyltransferase [Burkholderiaceae bacterium]